MESHTLQGMNQNGELTYSIPYFTVDVVAPHAGGDWWVVDATTGEEAPHQQVDLATWFPPASPLLLVFSTSRWDHDLWLVQANGERRPIEKHINAGDLSFDAQGRAWFNGWYSFYASATFHSFLDWWIEDTTNGERTANNPSSTEAAAWIALADPKNLVRTESTDGTFALAWTFAETSTEGAFKLERRESASEPWQTIDTFPAAETLDPVEHTASARAALAPSEPGKTASIRVFYEYGGIRSAPSNTVSLPNKDTDGDGLPDWWELAHGFSTTVAANPGTDSDGDGVTDAVEFAQKTDPKNADDFDPDPIAMGVDLRPIVLDVENSVADPDRTHIELRWNTPSRTDILNTKVQRKAGLNVPWQTLAVKSAGDTSHDQSGLYACLKYSYRLLFRLPDNKAGISNIVDYEVPLIRALIIQSADSFSRFPGFLQFGAPSGPPQKFLGYRFNTVAHDGAQIMSDHTVELTLTPDTRTFDAAVENKAWMPHGSDPATVSTTTYTIRDQAPSPQSPVGLVNREIESDSDNGTLNVSFSLAPRSTAPFHSWWISSTLQRADADSIEFPRSLALGSWTGTFNRTYHVNEFSFTYLTQCDSEGVWSGSFTATADDGSYTHSELSSEHQLSYSYLSSFDGYGYSNIPSDGVIVSDTEATWQFSSDIQSIYRTWTWTLSLPHTTEDFVKLAVSNLQPHPADFLAPYLCDASRWGTWGGSRIKLVYDPLGGMNEPWEPEGVELLKGFPETKVSQFRLSADQTFVAITRSQYKFTINPVAPNPDIAPIISFEEIFVPTNSEGWQLGNSAAFQRRRRIWTAIAGDIESPVFISDPIADSEHPDNTPLGYSVLGRLPIEMTWGARPGFENVEVNQKVTAVDESELPATREWMPGKGSRIFPDRKNPTDTTTNRNRCVLHIKGKPHLTVFLKSFDVDDATSDEVDNDPAHRIDPNGQGGNDNMDTVFARTGRFVSSNSTTTQATLNANGEVNVIFETTKQPGDNFRVALAFNEADLDNLDVTPSASAFIAGDSEQQPPGFSGVVSPMLTVWRRLWCEFDSMGTAPTTGSEANFDQGYVRSISVDGNTIALMMPLRADANRFQDGKIYIAGIGDYSILSNTDRGDLIDDDIVVQGPVPAAASGKQCWIYDDDYFSVNNNPPRAMPYQLSGGSLIYSAFADAFIEPIKVPAQFIQMDVPFKRNHDQSFPIVWQHFVSSYKNVPSTEVLWSAHLLAAWQPRDSGSDSDYDPLPVGNGTWLLGISQDWGNFGEIYVETNREDEIFQLEPRTQEQHTVVHEIGHQGSALHDDDGLMTPGAPPYFLQQSRGRNDRFTPVSIKRFRENRTY